MNHAMKISDKTLEITIPADVEIEKVILRNKEKTLFFYPDEEFSSCYECKDYDHEKHYCPRFCKVIRETLKERSSHER